MKGKVVLITGAGSGIGRSIAHGVAKVGGIPVLAGRRVKRLQSVAAELKEFGAACLVMPIDITDPPSVRKGVRKVVRDMGQIDVLVNNAGQPLRRRSVHEFTADAWMRSINVNLMGHVAMLRETLPHFIRRRAGNVINVSSIAGLVGIPGMAPYAAAKAALIALTRSVAIEYAPWGMTCSCVCPGTVATDMTRDYISARQRLGKPIATGVLAESATPDEVAMGVLYLCQSGGALATGGVLVLDGGYTAF